MNFNKTFLGGNLTRDPEIRYSQSGMAVCTLGLAVNRRRKLQDGSYAEEVDFINVTAFGKTAENANQYLGKGSPIFVEGQLRYESWDTPEGERRSAIKVIADRVQFLGRRSEGHGAPNQPPPQSQPPAQQQPVGAGASTPSRTRS